MSDYDVYTALVDSPESFKPAHIPAHKLEVSDTDRSIGYVERYFVQRILDPMGEIIEVSPSIYETLRTNHMYRRVSLTWRVSGKLADEHSISGVRSYTGVLTANTTSLALAAKTMPGITSKLINPKQYWIE